MTTLDPLPFGYEDLSSTERLNIALRFADLMGKSPRRWETEEENAFRRYASWYLAFNRLGVVFRG